MKKTRKKDYDKLAEDSHSEWVEQKPKKVKPFNLKSFIIQTLRRATYRYPPRNEALKKARVGRGLYTCAECGPNKIYKRDEIAVDHIKPVVDPETGFRDWNSYVSRMFPEENGFAVLCISPHHNEKTDRENRRRKVVKSKQRKNDERRHDYRKKKLKKLNVELDTFMKDCGIAIDKKKNPNKG